jgi:hypothetical protein
MKRELIMAEYDKLLSENTKIATNHISNALGQSTQSST